ERQREEHHQQRGLDKRRQRHHEPMHEAATVERPGKIGIASHWRATDKPMSICPQSGPRPLRKLHPSRKPHFDARSPTRYITLTVLFQPPCAKSHALPT